MLKGINPLLTPDLLKVLCEMGHGDEIVVVDANFTAVSLGAGKPIVRLAGVGLAQACEAILSVFPLDTQVTQPVAFMHVSDAPSDHISPVQQAVIEHVVHFGGQRERCVAVERFAFYARVQSAYAIVQTGERQPFGNFIFKKAVI